MSKRIKKKLQKRGGYRSWKRWKSFNFHFFIHEYDKKNNKSIKIAVIGVNNRALMLNAPSKNMRVYTPDTIFRAYENFRLPLIEVMGENLSNTQALRTSALEGIRKQIEFIPYKGEITHLKEGDK